MYEENKDAITHEGLKNLQQQIIKLQEEIKRLGLLVQKAKSYGDLRENSEFQSAAADLRNTEIQIEHINSIIQRCTVVRIREQKEYIDFGAYVTMRNDNKIHKYQIVGDCESNIDDGKMTIKSLLAKAILGKKAGDIVETNINRIKKTWEILEVHYIIEND